MGQVLHACATATEAIHLRVWHCGTRVNPSRRDFVRDLQHFSAAWTETLSRATGPFASLSDLAAARHDGNVAPTLPKPEQGTAAQSGQQQYPGRRFRHRSRR